MNVHFMHMLNVSKKTYIYIKSFKGFNNQTAVEDILITSQEKHLHTDTV